MNYVGVDIHQKYSVLCALTNRGANCGKHSVGSEGFGLYLILKLFINIR